MAYAESHAHCDGARCRPGGAAAPGQGPGGAGKVAERARIVLLAADGLTGPQIAERTGCTEPTVIKWRRQHTASGLAGLEDAPRGGGPVTVLTEEAVCQILAATLTPPPESLQAQGITHWSSRRLADWLRRSGQLPVSHDSVIRVWRRFCLAPHRTQGFKFSTDPELDTRSKTSSACTCTRPTTQWCCAWMRSPSARRWSAPSRSCRCARASPSGTLTTTPGTESPACSPPSTPPPARSPTPVTPAIATRSS